MNLTTEKKITEDEIFRRRRSVNSPDDQGLESIKEQNNIDSPFKRRNKTRHNTERKPNIEESIISKSFEKSEEN